MQYLYILFTGRNFFTGHPGFLQDCFKFIKKEMTMDVLKYLWIDCNSASSLPSSMNVRTSVFPDKDGIIRPLFFFPKK